MIYLAALTLLLLHPFQFSSPFVSRANSVTWQGTEGVAFGTSGILLSAEPPVDLYRRIVSGQGLAVEVWLKSASAHQVGPARIISYSKDEWHRNFTLGQEGDALVFRLTTAGSNDNGIPSLDVPGASVAGRLRHVVATYDGTEKRIYIDGRLRGTAALAGGSLRRWDSSHYLVFGNEADGSRAWNGSILFAAVYDKALSPASIARLLEAGPKRELQAPAQPVIAYDFTRGISPPAAPSQAGSEQVSPQLTIPARIAAHSRHFSHYSIGTFFVHELNVLDFVANIFLFVPFGVLGFVIARRRLSSASSAILVTVGLAALFSATCEFLQLFESARHASLHDIVANTAGAYLGAAVGCSKRSTI